MVALDLPFHPDTCMTMTLILQRTILFSSHSCVNPFPHRNFYNFRRIWRGSFYPGLLLSVKEWLFWPVRLGLGLWLPLTCYSLFLSLQSHMCSLASYLCQKVSPLEQASPWVRVMEGKRGEEEREGGKDGGRPEVLGLQLGKWTHQKEKVQLASSGLSSKPCSPIHIYHQKANSLSLLNSQVCGSAREERGIIITKHFTSSHGHIQGGTQFTTP